MARTDSRRRSFTATVIADRRGRVPVPVPFDPDEAWGPKPRHHVTGTVNAMGVRAVVGTLDDGFRILLGAAWRRGCGIGPGDTAAVELEPEGPQRDDLPDLRAALGDDPDAAAFWDPLAQFYRNAYLWWIDATKRRRDQRALRIAEVFGLPHAPTGLRPDQSVVPDLSLPAPPAPRSSSPTR